jgi:hypothetical protein
MWAFSAIRKAPALSLAAMNRAQLTQYDSIPFRHTADRLLPKARLERF